MGKFFDDGSHVRHLAERDQVFPSEDLDLQSLQAFGITFTDIKLGLLGQVFPSEDLDLQSLQAFGITFTDIKLGLLEALPRSDEDCVGHWDRFSCQISGRNDEALLVTVVRVEINGVEKGMVVQVSIHHGGW